MHFNMHKNDFYKTCHLNCHELEIKKINRAKSIFDLYYIIWMMSKSKQGKTLEPFFFLNTFFNGITEFWESNSILYSTDKLSLEEVYIQ